MSAGRTLFSLALASAPFGFALTACSSAEEAEPRVSAPEEEAAAGKKAAGGKAGAAGKSASGGGGANTGKGGAENAAGAPPGAGAAGETGSVAGSGGGGVAGSASAGAGGKAIAGAGGKAAGGASGAAAAGAAGKASGGAAGAPNAEGGGAGSGASGASGVAGAGGKPFVPPPLPTVSDDPPAACAAANGSAFQFLDDACKAKKKPSKHDRDRACPMTDPSPIVVRKDGSEVTYRPADAAIVWESKALDGIVPDAMRITVILVRRVGGVPHYRYLSNGTHAQAYQPWSSSKFMAAANAAATLRIESDYKVGLTAKVGSVPLGDLVTSIHNYDNNPYSSNALGRYFHDIGGRAKANALIHDWLKRPASETFGGNYGQAAPALGYTFKAPSGAAVTVPQDTTAGPSNHFSTFTAAEFLKRLVHHREIEATRLPGIQWEDLRVLFYGAEKSAKYGDWGGMTADTTTYVQQYDMAYLEKRSQGQWVTFSKLGNGTDGELVSTNYACFPQLDDADQPVPGWGREFLIATQLEEGGSTWKARDRLVATAYRAVLKRIMDGSLLDREAPRRHRRVGDAVIRGNA